MEWLRDPDGYPVGAAVFCPGGKRIFSGPAQVCRCGRIATSMPLKTG